MCLPKSSLIRQNVLLGRCFDILVESQRDIVDYEAAGWRRFGKFLHPRDGDLFWSPCKTDAVTPAGRCVDIFRWRVNATLWILWRRPNGGGLENPTVLYRRVEIYSDRRPKPSAVVAYLAASSFARRFLCSAFRPFLIMTTFSSLLLAFSWSLPSS